MGRREAGAAPAGIEPTTGRRSAAGAILALCIGAFALPGCGFQLRGTQALPFESVFVQASDKSEIAQQLRRALVLRGGTRLAASPEQAQAKLIVTAEEREKSILSLDSAGRVREFRLRYRMGFQLKDSAGRDLLEPGEVFARRDITFSDSEVLAKEIEESQLYRDMQNDLVDQMLRRMTTAKRPG